MIEEISLKPANHYGINLPVYLTKVLKHGKYFWASSHQPGPTGPGSTARMQARSRMNGQLTIRNAKPSDLDEIIVLDTYSSKAEKPDYWRGIFAHYVTGGTTDRIFLVAESKGKVVGFIVGEVRAWEFGSPPCGWVFALAVSPNAREGGVGRRMFDEISLRLKQAGVGTVRTMVDRDDKLTLSFFRGMGLRTGKYIELEKSLD